VRARRRLATAVAVVTLGAACRVVADRPPEGLEVTVSLRTPRVAVRDYPRGVALTVRATNTGSGALTIGADSAASGALQPSAIAGFGLRAFAEDGRQVIGTALPARDSDTVFAAGQTRRQRFLLTLGADRTGGLAPGRYTLVATFAGRESAPVQLTVVP
jgi:hypothetical protein